ncbi:hypothetical protein [Micromonospora sp. NBC_01638]|uniref:hypothetical protein n=1 Tax=Micromonospora sp. NBC_01638 TaxID=2975982 RepID=UPI0038672FE7|nr:hypothetical protein OG811_06725 [Micromonospora sp. NBC_01638]
MLFLGPAYGIDPAGKFLLTAVPAAPGVLVNIAFRQSFLGSGNAAYLAFIGWYALCFAITRVVSVVRVPIGSPACEVGHVGVSPRVTAPPF